MDRKLEKIEEVIYDYFYLLDTEMKKDINPCNIINNIVHILDLTYKPGKESKKRQKEKYKKEVIENLEYFITRIKQNDIHVENFCFIKDAVPYGFYETENKYNQKNHLRIDYEETP